MAEYINREDVLKCLEYNTIQKPSANDIVSATLRVAREKVEKLPVAQEESLFSFWRDPDKDPPKVETEVLILFETACGGYGITTAHYEDGTVLSKKSAFYWEELFEWGTYDEESDDYFIPKGWWEYRYFNPDDVYDNRVDSPVVGWMPLPPKEVVTLNADQLKAVLSMESSLGHIHTLVDVENTIDFLAKEEQEVTNSVEKFNIFDTMWSRKIQAAFPQSFVNMQNELIFSLRTDSGFSLKDVTDETQLKVKILEWLTRTAIKAVSPKERKLHFEGINKLLGTNFTLEEMTDIYTYLGNGIEHDLCVKFVESGYDMTLLPKEV